MMYEKVRKIRTPLRTEESIFLQKNKNIKTLKPKSTGEFSPSRGISGNLGVAKGGFSFYV